MNRPRCKSCRYWQRSYNFKSAERDWGLCHFWGYFWGAQIGRAFVDGSGGHEPRGANTCGWHNAAPVYREQGGSLPVEGRPEPMIEGEYLTEPKETNHV